MQKITLLSAFVCGILFTTLISWENNTLKKNSLTGADSNPVLAFRKIKLKEGDNSKRSEEASKMVDDFFAKYNPEFDKLAEVIIPAGKKGYVDYIILK
jgi:hypothetical protein